MNAASVMHRKKRIGTVMAAYGFPIKTMTESQCVAERYNPFFRNSRRPIWVMPS